jgi:hypothetical protein
MPTIESNNTSKKQKKKPARRVAFFLFEISRPLAIVCGVANVLHNVC